MAASCVMSCIFMTRFPLSSLRPSEAGLLAMAAAWVRESRSHHTSRARPGSHGAAGCGSCSRAGPIVGGGDASLVVSRSEQAFLVDQGVLQSGRSLVLASGSISESTSPGSAPTLGCAAVSAATSASTTTDLVFLFLGRIARDKEFRSRRRVCLGRCRIPRAALLIVGRTRTEYGGNSFARRRAAAKLRFGDLTDAPEESDRRGRVICLPSYRRGVRNGHSGGCGGRDSAVASRIYGITDAVVEGETGLLHKRRAAGSGRS